MSTQDSNDYEADIKSIKLDPDKLVTSQRARFTSQSCDSKATHHDKVG